MKWAHLIIAYSIALALVWLAREFTWSLAAFHASQLMTAFALIVGPVALSLAAQEWVRQ